MIEPRRAPPDGIDLYSITHVSLESHPFALATSNSKSQYKSEIIVLNVDACCERFGRILSTELSFRMDFMSKAILQLFIIVTTEESENRLTFFYFLSHQRLDINILLVPLSVGNICMEICLN